MLFIYSKVNGALLMCEHSLFFSVFALSFLGEHEGYPSI